MDDSKKKKDLTRLEDMSEFIHKTDPDIDAQLETFDSISGPELPQMPSEEDFSESEPSSLHEELGEISDVVEVSEYDEGQDDFSTDNEFSAESDFDSENDFEDTPWDPDDDTGSFTSEDNAQSETYDSEDLSVLQSLGGQTESFEVAQEPEDSVVSYNPIEDPVVVEDVASEVESAIFEEPVPNADIEELSVQESFEIAPTIEEVEPVVVEAKENFQDLANYGKSITPTESAAPGNPPYTLLIKNITYEEEGEEILRILGELGVLNDENRATFEKSIEMGNVMVSQLGEFLAVQICHKLRNHTFDIEMGLSEKIHPSDLYSEEERGLINRGNIRQNKEVQHYTRPKKFSIEEVLLTTTPGLENKNIVEYLGVITDHELVNEHELYQGQATDETQHEITGITQEIRELLSDDELAESTVASRYQGTLAEIYQGLTFRLRQQAYELGATAVVNINFQLTPLTSLHPGQSVDLKESRYKITCTGNAVVAKDP